MSWTPGKWTVSTNEEYWSCPEEWDTKDEAIAGAAAALDLKPGDSFYVGEIRKPKTQPLDAESIIERARDEMYDSEEGIEDCSFLEDVTHEQEKELGEGLTKVWNEWLAKHGHEPDWTLLGRVEQHDVPGGDS